MPTNVSAAEIYLVSQRNDVRNCDMAVLAANSVSVADMAVLADNYVTQTKSEFSNQNMALATSNILVD